MHLEEKGNYIPHKLGC